MKKTYWLLLILFIGFLLRFFYIYFFIGFNTPPESHGYWLEKVAYNLSKGDGFASQPNTPTAKKPPLYPAFLAFLYLFFGQNFLIARLGHIILALLTCLMVFLISKKLSIENDFAVLSSLLLAVDLTYVYVAGWFLTENLCILFSVLTIFYFLKIEENASFPNQIMAGFFLAMTNLTRPNFVSFILIIPVWAFLIFPKKEAFKICFTVISASLILIAPWMIRNWKIYNGFIPIATGSGRIFLASNNPEAIGDTLLISGSPRLYFSPEIPEGESKKDWTKWKGDTWQNIYLTDLDSETAGSGLNEKEADEKYYKQGLFWIKNNPYRFLKLLPMKIYRLWQYWSPHTRWPSQSKELKYSGSLYYYVFMVFSFYGIFVSLKQKKIFIILYLVLLYSQLTTLVFFGDARQRFLFLPFLSIFAGLGATSILSKLSQCKTSQEVKKSGE